MSRNGSDVNSIVESFMGKFQGQLRNLVTDAVNDGARQGGDEVRKKIATQLAAGLDLEAANDAPRKKRHKGAKGSVKCPVANCKQPGVRPMNCFCREHFTSLPEKKRLELREAQVEAKKKAVAA